MKRLSINRITKRFEGLTALDEVSFQMSPLQIKGLVGPNGAGKTTLFHVITGFVQPESGGVKYGDRDLVSLAPHKIAQLGLIRTFQQSRVLPEASVLENVLIGSHRYFQSNLLELLLRLPRSRNEEKEARERARHCLSRVGLADRARDHAENLTVGQERLLQIARAMAADPDVLFLDEPAAGLTAQETRRLGKLIKTLRSEDDLSVLLIEHDMGLVMDICDSVAVLDHGTLIADGSPEEVREEPQVLEAYLGADST